MYRTYKWQLLLSPCHLQTGTSEGEASAHLSESAHFFPSSGWRAPCNFLENGGWEYELTTKRHSVAAVEPSRKTASPLDPVTRWATASFLCWKSCSLMTSSDNRCLLAAEKTNNYWNKSINTTKRFKSKVMHSKS